MEDQQVVYKHQHQSIPSNVSTSADSIDIDNLNASLVNSKDWLSKILEEGAQEITDNVVALMNNENKLVNTLNKSNSIISNKFYLLKKKENMPELISIIELGTNIESHPNVVHGGFSATIVDNCLGLLATQLFKIPVTKTLTIAYKKPIKPGQTIVVISKVKQTDQRDIQVDRSTLISEVFDLNKELLLSSEAVFVDISNRKKPN